MPFTKPLSLITTCLCLVVLLGTTAQPVLAVTAPAANQNPAATNSGQGLEIAPPVVNVSANPGETTTAQIFLRNVSSGSLVVTGQANDFVAAGEDGTPKLILEEDESTNPYSVKGWITGLPKLTIVPKEIKTMSIKINVPADASPGGHYGVIRFTATPADLKTTGVSLSASLGALILITVNGATSEKLTVASFNANSDGKKGSFFESGPISFTQRFKNEGNVHVQPVGQVTVKDMFGKKIASLNVNLPPRNILPGSIRKFDQPLDKSVIGNKKLFGRYTAELSVTYGANKTPLKSTVSFWIIPYTLIAALALLAVIGFFVIRNLLRRYNQRIIAQSRRK